MRFRAIPRAWIDLKAGEVLSLLLGLVRLNRVAGTDLVPEFEKAFARSIGTKGAVAFSSCRAGTYHSLLALNLAPEDEVILPAFTYWADAAMVRLAGLRPVFADVNFRSATIDPVQVEKKITPRTKVIFLTHLNGIPADMDPIMDLARKHNLRVLEDCARACGVRYKGRRAGAFDIGVFSFGYGKNFYIFGGGLVTADDEEFLARLRALKSGFFPVSKKSLVLGVLKGCSLKLIGFPVVFRFSLFPLIYAARVGGRGKIAALLKPKIQAYDSVPRHFRTPLSNIQARQGLRFLERWEEHNQRRAEIVRVMSEGLAGQAGIHLFREPHSEAPSSLYMTVWSGQKESLQRFLYRNKIDAEDESAADLANHERFRLFAGQGGYPNAAALNAKLFYLPSHPRLRKKDIAYIIAKVKEF